MTAMSTVLWRLVDVVVGDFRAVELSDVIWVEESVAGPRVPTDDGHIGSGAADGHVSVDRATVAQALAIVLFDDLCSRVPIAADYVESARRHGRVVGLDHGAVRTIDGPSGGVPAGVEQVARLLRPLGYVERETYDLVSLRMTGRSFAHVDHPETVPQWFVSELHIDRLGPETQTAAAALFGRSVDPLTTEGRSLLDRLAADGALEFDDAVALLNGLARCFRRLHPEVTDRDYDLFAHESPELAWIATEGTTCNHWTDRVDDVVAAADAERASGRPVKDVVEVSASGRVLQTAHRAAVVTRGLHTLEGDAVVRRVPGSFFELIERRPRPDGAGLDLAFDAANATAIFAMTRPADTESA